MKAKRILFVGMCMERYTAYMRDTIKKTHPEAKVGVVNLLHGGKDRDVKLKQYDATYELNLQWKNLSPMQKGIRFILNLWRKEVAVSIVKLKWHIAKKHVMHAISSEPYIRIIQDFNPTHVHLFFPATYYNHWALICSSNTTFIASFIGSDLMNTTQGVSEFASQLKVVERADVITVQTPDLKAMLLAKFGQRFSNKVHLSIFYSILNKSQEILEAKSENAQKEFRTLHKIEKEKLCIQIGYSAAPGQNHQAILEQIMLLPEEMRKNSVFFIPLTYNNSGNYRDNLLAYLKTIGLDYRVFTSYLSNEEMLGIVANCLIHISARQTDAINAAMIESLYAGNVVITGAWLPYGVYFRKGVHLHAIDAYKDLAKKLEAVMNNLVVELEACKRNAYKLDQIFDDATIEQGIVNLYN
jgi:hypothetical protein